MVDKVLQKARATRKNWFEAAKMAVNIKGQSYYDIPDALMYRYPAPGSCPLDESDHPNLYKKHWKTPFRSSPYNIRQKEKTYTTAENTEHFIAELPEIDASSSDY